MRIRMSVQIIDTALPLHGYHEVVGRLLWHRWCVPSGELAAASRRGGGGGCGEPVPCCRRPAKRSAAEPDSPWPREPRPRRWVPDYSPFSPIVAGATLVAEAPSGVGADRHNAGGAPVRLPGVRGTPGRGESGSLEARQHRPDRFPWPARFSPPPLRRTQGSRAAWALWVCGMRQVDFPPQHHQRKIRGLSRDTRGTRRG